MSVPPLYLALPAPISTNALFANVPGKGRVKTKAYTNWVSAALNCIGLQRHRTFSGPVQIVLYVGEERAGVKDSDNTLKPVIDTLKKAGVIHDDSRDWVRSAQAIWVPGMAGMVASISPATASPDAALIVALVPKGMREVLR